MIFAEFFYSSEGLCTGFKVRGHAGAGKIGHDLVCCAVSASVQLCCNGITQILKKKAKVCFSDGLVCLNIVSSDYAVQSFLKSLELQLLILSKEHKKNLKLLRVEV